MAGGTAAADGTALAAPVQTLMRQSVEFVEIATGRAAPGIFPPLR